MLGTAVSLGRKQQLDQLARVAANALPGRRLPLLEGDLVWVRQAPHPPLPEQQLVDRAEATLERREHGRAERDRLAVHGAPGRDHEVREGDQARRFVGALGDDEAAGPLELLALFRRAWQHHRLAAA